MTISYKKLWIMLAENEMSKAELRRWVMGGTVEENEEAIQQIAAEDGGGQSALERILAGGGGDGE